MVYAFITREGIRELWDNILQQNGLCTKPCLILGDFNSVLTGEEKVGGNQVTWAEVVDFRNYMDTCGLIELPHQGNKYTWNDKYSKKEYFPKLIEPSSMTNGLT